MAMTVTPAVTGATTITAAGLAAVIQWLTSWPIKPPTPDVTLILAGVAFAAGHQVWNILAAKFGAPESPPAAPVTPVATPSESPNPGAKT